MAICQICGADFNGLHSKQRFCSKICREAHYAEYRLTQAAKNKSVVIQRAQRKISKPRLIETDADQARIKRECDERRGLTPDPGRSLKGTPEWDAAVAAASPPGSGRKVSPLWGLGMGSNKFISMRDDRNEKYVRYGR